MPTFKITVPEHTWARTANALDLLADDVGGEVEELGDGDPEHADTVSPPACGDLVEINGYEYLVTTQRIDGSLDLELRDELQEDSPLAH